MKLTTLSMRGAMRVEIEPIGDARGFFARLWCRDEFARAGVPIEIAQASASFNAEAGTLRGMHFAWPPAKEGKIVRCARGRALDVLLDLRPDSPQFLSHLAVELDADSHVALYVPPGVAHGFQTLEASTEIHYMMSEAYRPELAAGVGPLDPAFGIRWPLAVAQISERDRDALPFDTAAHRRRYEAGHRGRADAS